MSNEDFIIKKESGGYVVIRHNYPYEFHAHIKTISGCRILLKCIIQGKLPKSDWLQGSCRRLLTEDEFVALKRPKDRYYNSKFRAKTHK